MLSVAATRRQIRTLAGHDRQFRSQASSGTMRKAITFAFALLVLLDVSSARAQLQVDVNRAHMEPMPIAIPDFWGNSPNGKQAGANIAQVVAADLERSGLFRPLDR